ncbi:tetratricopeptide repeat protein [Aestuariivivens marinum]|uniref:tetratricopeptide repeat protein n=1 Tax=Aestuariivivens marinum TaxID=2913555 RepID=UPI001F584006|nr:tetratricopeptide repeat protein [Aestuariivivens marinum]
MRYILYIITVLLSINTMAQNEVLFNEANTLYNDGKYAESIDIYNRILGSGKHSAELYFNLGNAHYKLNNIAPSIYFYEKALQLSPNDEDIKNNLAFAKNMTIDDIDIIPETGFVKVLNNITHYFSFDSWAKTTVVFVFCFVILFLVYYFAYGSLKKRIAFMSSMVSLFLFFISIALAFHKYNLDRKDRPAIVFVSESKVKSEPNSRSEELFRLHEGAKVQILDTINDWKKIKLTDGKTGWVVNDDIKAL